MTSTQNHRGMLPVQPSWPFHPFLKEWVETSVAACFERSVAEYPNHLAVKYDGREWTYEALNRTANRIARSIVSQCGEEPAPIAFQLSRGVGEIAAILGILKAAKFYLSLDSSFPRNRLVQMLEDARPRAVITDDRNSATARELAGPEIPILNLDRLDANLSDANLGLAISPDHNAVLFFTSSSTGRAKGVLYDQRAVLHHVYKVANTIYLGPADRFPLLSSTAFAATLSPIFVTLLNGGSVHPFDMTNSGLSRLAAWLAREEITIYHSVPTTFRQMVETIKGETFPKLRLVRLAGETIARRDVELCRAHFGPNCIFNSALATTETAPLRQFFLTRDMPLEGSLVPVGYELPDTEVAVLDEQGNALGPNCIGEIAVKSRHIAVGYWNNSHLTNRVFLPDPAGNGIRTYLTGDLGLIRPDGCLEHHGRKDSQVKVRGHRIEVTEIEMALLDVASIKEVAVVVREDRPSQERLVAYVVPRGQLLPTVTELRRSIAKSLPLYMVPAAFVWLPAIPLTPTGKVDRLALPPPGPSRPLLDTKYVQPSDPSQHLLVALWEELLEVRPVGIGDSFFDLGGDSLLAVSLLARVEELYARAVPQAKFMAEPTIECLASILLEKDQAEVQPPLVKLQAHGSKTPFIFLHGDFNGGGFYCYDLARHLDPERPLYLLHPHGLFTPHVPPTIEAMAADLLVQILAAQPDGPYALGGHCNGAMVALEMARQLAARGSRVDALVLIAPLAVKPKRVAAAGRSAPAGPTTDGTKHEIGSAPGNARRQRLFETYRKCFSAYAPEPYSGAFTLLQPADAGPVSSDWREIGRKVDIRMIPGGHLSSITRYVADLAAELNQCLANSRSGHS